MVFLAHISWRSWWLYPVTLPVDLCRLKHPDSPWNSVWCSPGLSQIHKSGDFKKSLDTLGGHHLILEKTKPSWGEIWPALQIPSAQSTVAEVC